MKYAGFVGAVAAIAMAALTATTVQAQDYPTKPVTVVSGYSGSTSDIVGRMLAPLLEEELGQPFLVEEKLGAAGLLAEDFVSRAKPDGYTLLVGTSAMTVNAALRRGYVNHQLLKPVAVLASSPVFLYVLADSPFKTVDDVIAAAKAEPGKYTFGTSGVGSSAHLVMEIFQSATGTELLHVPYKGGADVMTALLAGEIDFRIATLVQNDDRTRPLMVFDTERMTLAPDVPSVTDEGLSGYFETLYGTILFAPVETPDEVTDKIHETLIKVLTPEIVAKIEATGSQVRLLDAEQSAALMASGIEGWTTVIDGLGLKMD